MESTNHGIEYLSLMREGPRNAEVTHLDYYLLQVIGPLGVLEEGILRLDVAVHFLLVVDYTHSRDQLQEYSQVKLHVLRFAAVFFYELIQVASYHYNNFTRLTIAEFLNNDEVVPLRLERFRSLDLRELVFECLQQLNNVLMLELRKTFGFFLGFI